MENLIDVIVAALIFTLFASLYRKRGEAAVRLWMIGWFCILVHFAVLLVHPSHLLEQTMQSIVSLSALVLCGIFFALSHPQGRASRRRSVSVFLILGVPWLAGITLGSLPSPLLWPTALCAWAGAVSMVLVGRRLYSLSRAQTWLIFLVATSSVAWLIIASLQGDVDSLTSIILTECFGLNAVLLSTLNHRRFSAATLTTTIGAAAWAFVWIGGRLVDLFAPHAVITPELWNLPKYTVAAGMILTLLEEEIHSAEEASEQYRLLFESNPHPMWMYDPDTLTFLQANDAAVQHYGYSKEEFRSLNLMQILIDGRSGVARAKLGHSGPHQLSGLWQHRRKDGSVLQVEIASQPVRLHGRRVIFALMHDITERQRLHATLLRQAEHDALTDLANRSSFERHFANSLERAALSGNKTAIFCVDLDRFKQINDTYGHATGDICLKEVAFRMTQLLSSRGAVGRSGGDEFLLCLSDFRDLKEADVFASMLLKRLTASVHFRRGELELGASIGFAVYPDDGVEGGQLWRDADAAMYQAKRAGGAQWVRVSDQIASSANTAKEIEVGLRRALKANDFELLYQPQYGLDGTLHSLEALLRSADPLLRGIPVDRIVSIAEESGLIVVLGNWVLEQVCAQFRIWLDQGLATSQIALNVSPLQLMRFDFARHVAETLERHNLSARVLEFEVTESTVMPDQGSETPHQIATLARMGIRFAVDDFGTGYSSLGRLHQLPVDVLKIDRSFTSRIAEENGTFPTVEAIIALAHTFGMKVVAEGVENEEQLALLRSLKCDRLQGYLYGHPLGTVETTALLRAQEQLAVSAVVA